jgi:hypothetical protein
MPASWENFDLVQPNSAHVVRQPFRRLPHIFGAIRRCADAANAQQIVQLLLKTAEIPLGILMGRDHVVRSFPISS